MSVKQKIKKIILALPLKPVFVGLRNIIRIFGVPGKSFYWFLRFRGNFKVAIDKDHSFLLKSDGASVENSIFWAGIKGEWEAASTETWIKLAQRAKVVLDVGANTGIYGLIVKSINPSARVFAFEPIDRIFKRLKNNVDLNKYDTECLNVAVSNQDGTTTIYDIPDENSYSSSLSSEFAEGLGHGVNELKIKTVRLDSFIRERNLQQVDLIKIDVETYEPQVMEGLGEYLDKYKPSLLIEILQDDIGEKVESFVKNKGYIYFDIDEETGKLNRVDKIRKSSSYNYLLCTENVAKDLGIQRI